MSIWSPVFANDFALNVTPYLGLYTAVSAQTWTTVAPGDTLGSSTRSFNMD